MNAVAMTAVVPAAPADGASNDGQGTGVAFGEALGLAGRSFAGELGSTEQSVDPSVEEAASPDATSPIETDQAQAIPADPGSTFAAALLLSAQPPASGAGNAGAGVVPAAQAVESAAVPQPVAAPPATVASGAETPAGAPVPPIAGTTPASVGVPAASTAAARSVGLIDGGDETAATTQGAASVPTAGRSSSSDTAQASTAPPGIPSSASGDADARHSTPVTDGRGASEARIANAAHPQATAASPVEQRIRVDGADRASNAAPPTPAASPVTPVLSAAAMPTVTPAESEAAPAPGARAVAAQVAPALISIAQRPAGTHQLTMTVNPDSLGPVTLRAHISAGGDVQVELVGATDAGREALRLIATDLRRDLASVMPHATLSLGQGSAADASGDRSGSPTGGDLPGDRGSDRGTARDQPSGGRPAAEHDRPRIIQTTSRAVVGEGLDIFA